MFKKKHPYVSECVCMCLPSFYGNVNYLSLNSSANIEIKFKGSAFKKKDYT